MRILVVDDDVDGADALAALLRQSGHEVEVAHDGTQALGLSPAFAPDAAIVDLEMPGMHGFEVARRLRQTCGPGLRVIAYSGHDDHTTRQRAAVDFDEYLRKPARMASIIKSLQP
jgi:CheY-like chemotaxis protein